VAAFLIQAGAAIIEHMAILFAIGVAYGLSKDKDGAGGIGPVLVGYLGFDDAAETERGRADPVHSPGSVPAAFGKIENQFVGILCGVIAAELYNRFAVSS